MEPQLQTFVDLVWQEGERLYRDLPWRNIDDPYGVLVSEIMLQQTQVQRVGSYWERFLASFPTIDALASASTADVLEHWQGLGYNRRALALKRAADIVAREQGGILPHDYDGLVALPGIGPATAGGVMAFAYQRPSVYIETNVRTVFIHHFFPEEEKVADKQLIPLVKETCSKDDPRGWYYALLDYGASLKKTVGNANRKSSSYTRQSAFEGSQRQKRAWLVREVLAHPEGITIEDLKAALDFHELSHDRCALDDHEFAALVDKLADEGFFTRNGSRIIP